MLQHVPLKKISTLSIELERDKSMEATMFKSDFKITNSSMMHLSLPKGIDAGQGTTKEIADQGVILSYLLKGEPPDVSNIPNKQKQQGKVLSSKDHIKTNLLSLGAGDIVSRSKPFQEGEYDEDIKSSSTKEHRTRSHEEESMKLRRAKEKSELSSAQMEAKFKHPSSTNTWRSHSTHSEFTTKKNQPERIPDEEDIEDTFWKVFNGRYGDLRSLIESFRSNQEDLSYKSNCSRFSTHRRNTANWTRFNQRSDQGVISFTNRVNRNFPDLDPGALIGGFRSNQREISYKPTWYGFLTQPGFSSNWIHANIRIGLRVIQLLNQKMLNLPYLEAHGFRSLQTYTWRPGEYLLQPEASHISSSFILSHWIRQIQPWPFNLQHFPYTAPRAFISGAINDQRLYTDLVHIRRVIRRLTSHGIIQKLSRYKSPRISPFGSSIQASNG